MDDANFREACVAYIGNRGSICDWVPKGGSSIYLCFNHYSCYFTLMSLTCAFSLGALVVRVSTVGKVDIGLQNAPTSNHTRNSAS